MMSRKIIFVSLSILLIALLPYILLAFFTTPSADDFLQAYHSLERGVLGYVQWRYISWNGRYAADFLVALYNYFGHQLSSVFLWKYYFVSSIFFVGFYSFSSYIFARIFLMQGQVIVGLIYALISTISALSHTEVRSTFFWLSGGIAYTFANALFIILMTLILDYMYIKQNKFSLLASLLLIPLINGLSETVMVTYTVFILTLSILDTLLRQNRNTLLLEKLVWSILAIVSGLIVYLAPGNHARIPELDQVQINYVVLVWDTTVFTLLKVFHWITPFWIALVLTIILLSQLCPNPSEVATIFKDKYKFFVIVASLSMSLFVSYLIRFYLLRTHLPLRADSVSYTVFYLITLFVALYFSYYLRKINLLNSLALKNPFLGCIVLFSLFSFGANYSFYTLVNDFQLLRVHHDYYQINYATLAQAERGSEIELPPEPRVKILRWKCYLTDNSDYWVNQAVADYFGIESVVVIGGGGPDPEASGAGECGGEL